MTAPESKGYWVYIGELVNGRLYVGITDNLIRRTAEHLQRKSSTRTTHISSLGRILYKERHPDRPSAHKRERQIKGWAKAKKSALSAGDIEALTRLSRSRSRRSNSNADS